MQFREILPSNYGPAKILQGQLLQDPSRWYVPPSNGVPDVLKVDKVIGDIPNYDYAVSTSMFAPEPLRVPAKEWTWADFHRCIPSDKGKYWLPLSARTRAYYPKEATQIVYLDPMLEAWAEPMIEAGIFNQVRVMKDTPEKGWVEGSLWRYLPILDRSFGQVFCSGVDLYDFDNRFVSTMMLPCRTGRFSVAYHRHPLYMAGPMTICPKFLYHKLKAPEHGMEEYITSWLELERPSGYMNWSAVLNNRGNKLTDASFLAGLLWNKQILQGASVNEHHICDVELIHLVRQYQPTVFIFPR